MRCRWAVRKDIPKSGTNVRAGADHVFPYKGAVLQGTNAHTRTLLLRLRDGGSGFQRVQYR